MFVKLFGSVRRHPVLSRVGALSISTLLPVILLLAAGWSFVSTLAFAFQLVFQPIEQIPFTVSGWHNAKYEPNGLYSGTRLQMVEDLLRQYDFHGWTLSEVEALLGKGYDLKLDRFKWNYTYELKGFNRLDFYINEQMIVEDYQVHWD